MHLDLFITMYIIFILMTRTILILWLCFTLYQICQLLSILTRLHTLVLWQTIGYHPAIICFALFRQRCLTKCMALMVLILAFLADSRLIHVHNLSTLSTVGHKTTLIHYVVRTSMSDNQPPPINGRIYFSCSLLPLLVTIIKISVQTLGIRFSTNS